MKEKFMRFMQGRYGLDQFSRFLLIAGIVVVLLSLLLSRNVVGMIFYFLGWVLETVAAALQQKQFVNRGLVNAPLCVPRGLAYGILIS